MNGFLRRRRHVPRAPLAPHASSPSRASVRWFVSFACLLVACLGLGGCKRNQSSFQHEPGVAVIVPTLRATWIRNFNPFFESQARWPAVSGIYEPLLIYNRATSEWVPWLATKWTWEEDNRALAFEIRQGVEWKDGTLLTPRDVVYTFELMKKHPAMDNFAVWKHVDRVYERGQQVVFHFAHPFTLPGLSLVGERPIVAEHVWKNVQDPVKFADEDPIGTGPFNRINSFKPQVYEVGRNPRYWQPGKPKLKAIRLPAFAGNEQQALAIIKGDIDWGAAFLPAIDRIFVGKDPKHHGYWFPSLEGTVMLYPNTRKKPFDDVRVRKALSMSFDRERIVRIAMQNYTRPADATALSDLYTKYHDQKVLDEEGDWTKFNPEAAKKTFDELGMRVGPNGYRTMPDGSPLRIDLNCVVGWSDWIIAAQIMVKDLQNVGIDAVLRTYEFGAWFNRLQVGDFQLSMSWSDGDAAPYLFYQRFMSRDTLRPLGEAAENNWHRFSSDKADELLAAFARTADEKEQMRLASELQREFVRQAPAIPLFPGPTWGEFNTKRVKGFPTKENPWAALAPYKAPGLLLPLVALEPVEEAP